MEYVSSVFSVLTFVTMIHGRHLRYALSENRGEFFLIIATVLSHLDINFSMELHSHLDQTVKHEGDSRTL